MDMESRSPRIGDMTGEEYMILEGLLRQSDGSQNSCPCNNNSADTECPSPHFANNVHLAMVYSPDQDFAELYSPEKGLEAGTVFMKLDKPFGGRTISGGRKI